MQCERASSTDALLRLDPLSLNLNCLSLFLSLSSKQPRPFPPAHGGSGFLSQCFQDAAFVVLPSTLLALAALLSAARARGSSGGGGDPRRRQRRRRGSSPASSPSSPSSPLRVAALRSALLSSLSGVAMILFFAYSATLRRFCFGVQGSWSLTQWCRLCASGSSFFHFVCHAGHLGISDELADNHQSPICCWWFSNPCLAACKCLFFRHSILLVCTIIAASCFTFAFFATGLGFIATPFCIPLSSLRLSFFFFAPSAASINWGFKAMGLFGIPTIALP